MEEEESNNKRFLKTLKEKIFNINSVNEIDNENRNLPEIAKNIQNEKEELEEEKLLHEEKKNSEKSDSYPEIPQQNINLKESVQFPIESKDIQIEESKNNHIYEKNNLKVICPSHLQKLFPIKSALCKIHGKTNLKLNETNFEIVCEKCLEEGNISEIELKNNLNYNDDMENSLIFNCFEHQTSKGSFYCNDCKQFICKRCFADLHREHKCHLPKVIKDELINYVNKEIEKVTILRPILEENINDIKKIYNNLKKQKDDTMKIPQNTLKVIGLNNENEISLLMKKTNEKFMGIDFDVNDDAFTFNGIKEKNKKFIDILKTISNDIINKENHFDLCGYHKKKNELLKEINNFIYSSFNFINTRLNQTNEKFSYNYEKIENSLNLMNKEIINYEKSCISSIFTGRENRAIVLLRYIRFVHREIKYFKNSLIGFASNENIFLTGLVVCGLHIKRKKNKISINNTNMAEYNNNNNINDSNNNEDDVLNDSKKIIIPIQINVYKMVKKAEGEKLFTQKCELTGVKSSDDPCIIINFEKGVKIFKDKLYLIKVENISENNYIDLWTGCVGKNNIKNIKMIRCHNSGIQFLFKQSEGIQTDFDEFEQGIIGGVLYSPNK